MQGALTSATLESRAQRAARAVGRQAPVLSHAVHLRGGLQLRDGVAVLRYFNEVYAASCALPPDSAAAPPG